MKKGTVAMIAAAGTAAALAAIPGFRKWSEELTASHYVFRSPKVRGALEGCRITVISDLRNREFGKENCRLLALTEAQLPDLLVLTGDLPESRTELDGTLDTVSRLTKIAPCYYVPGSLTRRMSRGRQAALRTRLEAAGVVVLRNEAARLGLSGDLRLLGVESGQPGTDALRALMTDRPEQELNILLVHRAEARSCERAGADLVLAGHADFVSSLLRKGGLYRAGGTAMCVSRGLRGGALRSRPELATVILRGERI